VDFLVDTIKIALYDNTATLNASTTAYTTTGEVVATGYTATGNTLTPSVTLGTDGIAYVDFADTSWTAAITARGALIYKSSGTAICVLDFGSDKTSVMTFTVQFPVNDSSSALIRLN
jgi:hypothetical protein